MEEEETCNTHFNACMHERHYFRIDPYWETVAETIHITNTNFILVVTPEYGWGCTEYYWFNILNKSVVKFIAER